MEERLYGTSQPQENLIPVLRVNELVERRIVREEGWSLAEAYYELLLQKERKNGRHLVYLCSPLKPTESRPVEMHISEAIWVASHILGAKYNRKRIAVWIPHLHVFTVYNEIVYPDVRERAINFNNRLLPHFFHTLVVNGDRRSEGMLVEIALAERHGLEVIGFEDFKGRLQNLPTPEEVERYYWKMVALHNEIHGPKFLIE